MIDTLGSFNEVGGLGVGNVYEGLGIAVGQREPGTLDLHYDAVATAEGMVHVLERGVDLFHFAGSEGFGLFEAVAELAAEGLAAHELLISAHGEWWRRHVVSGPVDVFWTGRVQLAVGIVGGIDVDELHIEVRICSAGRNEKSWRDRTRDGHVFLQNRSLIHQHIGAARGETLIGKHIFLWHIQRDVIDERYRFGRIADIFIERRRVGCRRVEREPAISAEIQCFRFGIFRRPGRVLSPDVAASLENIGFRELRFGTTF